MKNLVMCFFFYEPLSLRWTWRTARNLSYKVTLNKGNAISVFSGTLASAKQTTILFCLMKQTFVAGVDVSHHWRRIGACKNGRASQAPAPRLAMFLCLCSKASARGPIRLCDTQCDLIISSDHRCALLLLSYLFEILVVAFRTISRKSPPNLEWWRWVFCLTTAE